MPKPIKIGWKMRQWKEVERVKDGHAWEIIMVLGFSEGLKNVLNLVLFKIQVLPSY